MARRKKTAKKNAKTVNRQTQTQLKGKPALKTNKKVKSVNPFSKLTKKKSTKKKKKKR